MLAPFSLPLLLFFRVGVILLLVFSLSSRALYDGISESEANGCLTFLSHEVIGCARVVGRLVVVFVSYSVSHYAPHMCLFLLCEIRNIIDQIMSTTLLVRTS